MEKITIFFTKTRYFWLVSKILITLMFVGVLITLPRNFEYFFALSIFSVFAILILLTGLILDFLRIKTPLLLKVTASMIMIFIAYSMFMIINQRTYLSLIFIVWTISQGISELVNKVTAANSGFKQEGV